MKWLFNIDHLPVTGRENEKISWDQARKFKGKKGDKVIFYSWQGRIFIYLYKIISVKTDNEVMIDDKSRMRITVELAYDDIYKEEKELTDYIYSFPRVKHFDEGLYLHFSRKYYRLSDIEFDAIDKDEIFLSRTILGIALNAIHIDHRKAFAISLVEEYPTIIQNEYDNSKVLKLFYEYLDFAVIKPAKQLDTAYSYLEEMIESNILSEISFQGDKERPNQSIQKQVYLIQENIKRFESSVSSSREFESDKESSKFKKLFKNNPLPIDLNN